jgi:hypothetical protein
MEPIGTILRYIDMTMLGIGLLVAGVIFLVTGLVLALPVLRRRKEQTVAESQGDAGDVEHGQAMGQDQR